MARGKEEYRETSVENRLRRSARDGARPPTEAAAPPAPGTAPPWKP
nr:MAG TPA: hypothetical protein [Caudoviricetes sp.]